MYTSMYGGVDSEPCDPASRRQVGFKANRVRPLHAPDAAGDEARDGLTFFIITPDGLPAIQHDSLYVSTLNLAEKSERPSLPPR